MSSEQNRQPESRRAEQDRMAGRSAVRVRMEEQDHKFANDKRKRITGILQIRQQGGNAKVAVRIDNLMDCEKEGYTYKLFFIGRKDGASVYRVIGKIHADEAGHAMFSAALDPENVDGEGTPLSCFYIFLICAAEKHNTRVPLQSVLKGDLLRSRDRNRIDIPVEESSDGQPVRSDTDTDSSQAPGEHITAADSDPMQKRREFNNYYNEYIRQKTSALMAADNWPQVKPFEEPWLAEPWMRVTEMEKFPVASAGAQRQISQYGHFIFTAKDSTFYLAVPGRHTDDEWPDRGASGFLMWQPIRNSQEYGYWCMVIDTKTGSITDASSLK